MIDITKPLIPQVKKMTNKEFQTFVKRPRFIEDTDGIILFEDPKEDEENKTHYSTLLKVIVPLVLAYIGLAFYCTDNYHHFLKEFIPFYGAGVCIVWTYLEYYSHRFKLHKEINLNPEAEANPEELA